VFSEHYFNVGAAEKEKLVTLAPYYAITTFNEK